MGQQRLLPVCVALRDQRAAMAVGRGDEAPGHVVAKECDGCGMAAVGYGQRAASVGAVLRIGERRLRGKGDVRQIDAVPRKMSPGSTLPPLTTPGSVILTVLLMPEATWKFADV